MAKRTRTCSKNLVEHVLVTSHIEKRVELLIIGSGAAAMAAGIRGADLGLDVLLVEKSNLYGGSSAMSGGVCWVGNNHHMNEQGIADSDEEVVAYLQAITRGEVAEEKLRCYQRESKRMLQYFEEKTHSEGLSCSEF